MADERSLARVVLNYMKKHGDTADFDTAEQFLSVLDAEDAKRKEASDAFEQKAREADGEKVEGEAEGRGVQLTPTKPADAATGGTQATQAAEAKEAKADNKK